MSYVIKEKALRVDMRLTLAVVVTISIQLAAALLWAAHVDERVMILEKKTEMLPDANIQLARMEERLDGVRKDTDYIKRKLDNFLEKVK